MSGSTVGAKAPAACSFTSRNKGPKLPLPRDGGEGWGEGGRDQSSRVVAADGSRFQSLSDQLHLDGPEAGVRAVVRRLIGQVVLRPQLALDLGVDAVEVRRAGHEPAP